MDKILYLTHFTSLDNIPNIFKSGYLLTIIEREKMNIKAKGVASSDVKKFEEKNFIGEFPGIYLDAIFENNLGADITDYGDVILVFPNKLLLQKNWHFNIVDSNGIIEEETTYFHHNISKIPDMKKVIKFYNDKYGEKYGNSAYPGNEFVMHDKIDLNLLCEIWCKTSKTYEELIKLLPNKYHHLVKIRYKYPKINCVCDEKYINYDYLPFVISFNIEKTGLTKLIFPYDTKKYSSKTHNRKIMTIANIPSNIMEGLDNYKKINNYFIKNKLFSYYQANRDKQNLDMFYKLF